MTRQENAVPVFTYENEERESAYAERRRSVKRNPYLVDYARQYSQQGGREEDAAYFEPVNWQRKQNTVRKSAPAEGNGGVRRSPYPVESDGERRSKRHVEPINLTRSNDYAKTNASVRSGRCSGSMTERPAAGSRRPGSASERPAAGSRRPGNASERPAAVSHRPGSASERPAAVSRRPGNASEHPAAGSRRPGNASERPAASRPASVNRKKRALMQRLAIGLWALGILALAITIMFKDSRVSAAPSDKEDALPAANMNDNNQDTSDILVQGLPAAEFAKHPDWTENLLTPNEYSRPGEALQTVTNIFVHYTANPGTSAAQNRSYFEQQKDTHERSVSAHFIIGYEGEIIQCVPLDEIAYAVATRNSDSISIECCYLASDGSFTQETYDSLIALLAWLIDVYDLNSNDILRHYDCGGKKCPIYYTDHPGEWEQLKKDVDKL